MATQRRKPTGNLQAEPQGPLGHLLQDAINKKHLSRPRVAKFLNAAIKQDTGAAASITHSSVRNWISRWVIPREDTQRAILAVLDIPERTLAQAIKAQEAARAELRTQRTYYLQLMARPSTHLQSETLEADITLSIEESAQFVRRAGIRVNDDLLEQIGSEIKVIARAYIGRPPYALFRPIAQLRRDVFALSDTHQRPQHMTQLYFYAGQLCAMLAHLTTDLGQHESAETHARTAWLCADLCDHQSLRAYIRWVQSQIAYWSGDYRRAAEIAHGARSYATDRDSLLRIASQEARAWAAAGEARDVEYALATATAARDLDESADLVGVFRFPPGKAAYYSSEVHLSLGGESHARLALTEAEESLFIMANGPAEDTCPEFVSAAQLDRVLAHCALNSLDGAIQYLKPVLEVPSEHRTVQVVDRITKVASALGQHPSEPLAIDMREQIQMFAAYPAARQLPAITESEQTKED